MYLVVEKDSAVTEVCLSEVSGTDIVDAFLLKEPEREGLLWERFYEKNRRTLG